MATEGAAIRKRQQIAKANRMMFFAVAGASVVVGAALVLSIFLVQKAIFKNKVLAEKSNTATVLTKNNEVASELQNQIRTVNTSEDLRKLLVATSDGGEQRQPIQVVLDALPATANSSGFGASLQKRFLNMNGITLESLTVDPIMEAEVGTEESAAPVAAEEGALPGSTISFSFSVVADNAYILRELISNLERSIRPINITRTNVEVQGTSVMMTVIGNTYYQPARTVELRDKAVQP